MLFNLVGSTQSFVVLILSAVVGRFLDAGHIRKLLILGTLLVSLGSFLLSIVNGPGGYRDGNYGLTWLTQGLVSGFGMACFFVSSSQGMFSGQSSTCQGRRSNTILQLWQHGSKQRRVLQLASSQAVLPSQVLSIQ